MNDQPDLSFYFAIHEAQRAAIDRYRRSVETIDEADRTVRGKALARWAKSFALELDEHHYVEDAFFFPSLRSRVASAAAVLDRLEADHRDLDQLLARWPAVAASLADPKAPFEDARPRRAPSPTSSTSSSTATSTSRTTTCSRCSGATTPRPSTTRSSAGR